MVMGMAFMMDIALRARMLRSYLMGVAHHE